MHLLSQIFYNYLKFKDYYKTKQYLHSWYDHLNRLLLKIPASFRACLTLLNWRCLELLNLWDLPLTWTDTSPVFNLTWWWLWLCPLCLFEGWRDLRSPSFLLSLTDFCFLLTFRWWSLYDKSLSSLELYPNSTSWKWRLRRRFILLVFFNLCHKKLVMSSKAKKYVSHAAQHILQRLLTMHWQIPNLNNK